MAARCDREKYIEDDGRGDVELEVECEVELGGFRGSPEPAL